MLMFTKHLVALCLASTTAVTLGNNYDFPGPGGFLPLETETPFNVQVGESMEICDLDLEVSLSFTGNGFDTIPTDLALDFKLTGPGGEELEITVLPDNPPAGTSCTFSQTSLHVTFDDESPFLNNEVCSQDTVQPLEPLSTFDGATTNGQWTLEVLNTWFTGQGATLDSWVIHVTECEGTGNGDPHFKTWDGQWYDFHGECDLSFLNNPTFDAETGMWIQVRTKIRGGYSYIESAAIKIGDDILEVGAYGAYMINGVSNADMPNKLDSYTVSYDRVSDKQHTFDIVIGDGKKIVVQAFKDLVGVKTVGATKNEYAGSMGLMGEYGSGKMLGRNGTLHADPIAFATEWQVLQDEPKLFMINRYPQHPMECVMPDPKKMKGRRLGESIAIEAAEKACDHWGDQKDQCVYDVIAANDLELAEAGAF